MSPDPDHAGASPVATIRITDAADVVAGLAALFGFRPRESLCFLALEPPRHQIGFRARVDLPAPGEAEAIDGLLHAAAANGVRSVIVLAHSAHRRPEAAAAAYALADGFEGQGVDVRDAIVLDDRRFWSLDCDASDCCPAEGRPYDASSSRLVAEAVGAGQRVVADRSELEAEVAEPDEETARRMSRAYDGVRARLVQELGVDPAAEGEDLDLPVQRAGAATVTGIILGGVATGPEDLSDEAVATLGVWCRCPGVRNVAWALVDHGQPREHLRLWTAVAQRTIAPFEPAVLSFAAFCAWLSGDGARASCALDRALAADPDYSFAHLVRSVLVNAVPPSRWAPLSEEIRRAAAGSDD